MKRSHRRSGIRNDEDPFLIGKGCFQMGKSNCRKKISKKIIFVTIIALVLTMPLQSISKPSVNKPIIVKLATLAPNGSPWHEILKEMAAEWANTSDGQVILRIYPGGVAGDEADMIRKIRIGQLQAALVTNNGISHIASAANVLVIPMAMDSWEELYRVQEALTPRLEALLEEKGFVALNWGVAGWVRFFVPEADPSIKSVQQAKLFVWSGDDKAVELWKAAEFNAVPLAVTDILPALQTGMINAYSTTPVMALASQWFPFTPVMIDMPWAPLVGATIISKSAWNKVPESLRPKLKDIAVRTSIRIQAAAQELENEAIAEMQKRGLKIVKPNSEQLNHWKEVMKNAYPKIRGEMIPADWFDDALLVANEGS